MSFDIWPLLWCLYWYLVLSQKCLCRQYVLFDGEKARIFKRTKEVTQRQCRTFPKKGNFSVPAVRDAKGNRKKY